MVQVSSHKRFHGLDVNSNPLLVDYFIDRGSQRSSLVIADNCVLNRQYMVGNRHGFDYFTGTTSNLVTQLYEYQNLMVEHQEGNGQLYRSDPTGTGTRTQYAGTYHALAGHKMDLGIGRGGLYFTTTAGVMKLDAVANTPARAGLTKALDVRLTTTGIGNGFLGGFAKCAYRMTWVRTDANKNQIRSDVSARMIVTCNTQFNVVTLTSTGTTATVTTSGNHGYATNDNILVSGATQLQYNGTFLITVTGLTTFTFTVGGSPASPATGTITTSKSQNVTVAFTVPADILATDTYEIWRTMQLPATATDPGDNEFLVFSAVIGAGLASTTVTYTDTTTDANLAAALPLYTNATLGEGGAAGGNARPPVALTLASYKDYMIFGNCQIDHQFNLTFLSVLSLVNGSFITLTNAVGSSSRTYTAGAAESVATQSFLLSTTQPTPALNIAATAQSLCHVINGDAAGYYYAEYISGVTQAPGIIRIWARTPLTGAFSLIANNGTTGGQFSPTLPTSGITVISSNDSRINRLFISKYQQPDAVPLSQTLDVGRQDQAIHRIIAIRDALFIFKDDGTWFLSGLTYPFTLTELDTNSHIISAASAAVVDNKVYFLSNEGFIECTVSGTSVVSLNIEPLTTPLLPFMNLMNVCFGVGHLSEHSYICWVPSGSGDTYAKTAFVYHTFIKEWTRWVFPAAAAMASNVNYCLYLSSGLENAILKQRKNGNQTDYSDQTLPITITAQTGMVLTVTWPNSNFTPTAGLSILQGNVFSKVTAANFVSGTTWLFTVDRVVTYTNAAATSQMPIYCHIRLAPDVCQDVGLTKTFYNVMLVPEQNTITQATIELATNEAGFIQNFPITRVLTGGFGSNAWGATPWGDLDSPVRTIPFAVDLPIPDITGEALTIGFFHNVSQEGFNLAQVSAFYDSDAEYEVTQ